MILREKTSPEKGIEFFHQGLLEKTEFDDLSSNNLANSGHDRDEWLTELKLFYARKQIKNVE